MSTFIQLALRLRAVSFAVFALLLIPASTQAQTCFWYSDNVNANTGIQCVDKSTLAPPCSWPSDCTTIAAPGSQSVLQMHQVWHQCFGAVGGATPPVGRGQRWYAFHRQFEYDFNIWRDANSYSLIEQQDWCPGMNLAVGHFGAGLPSSGAGSHPSGCGTGMGRPSNVPCDTCIAFPQCLYVGSGGPMDCPSAPSSSCSAGGVSFSNTSLDQFSNVDDVAKLLDANFHGRMHGAIWIADLAPACSGDTDDPDCIYNGDTLTSSCSPRDPMFWRLHKALDDVVRAWQDHQSVDLMIVIDRSGSMDDPDPTGVTKLEAAVRSAEYFAQLMDNNMETGENRVGLVTYAGNATQKLPLTPALPDFTDSGTAFSNAINVIRSDGTGGCTSMGAGIEKALEALCPNGGDCRQNPVPAPGGTNARKAILLLTDGVENVQPCLQSAGGSGSTCGTQCFGASLDYDDLEFTQFVAVGFGNASALNGDLLTLLAERQGGIYVQNPGAPGDDLKYFFTMAFGQLTDEFVFVDPRGFLASNELVSPAVEYNSCADESKITYTSGWHEEVTPGDLRLLVSRPNGDLVRATDAGIQSATEPLWAFNRVEPQAGTSLGTWRGQLVRPHFQFYNGFAPDSFAKLPQGVQVIRREIQRLCPDGCQDVLLYESGVDPDRSAYRAAVKVEVETGLLGAVAEVGNSGDFRDLLEDRRWDLLVYAVSSGGPEAFDDPLTRLLCAGQRAIVSDLRPSAAANVLECAGSPGSQSSEYNVIEGDGRLFDGRIKLVHPRGAGPHRGFGLSPAAQATAHNGQTGAIIARGEPGKDTNWFVDVLGQGLGRISPVPMSFSWHSGEALEVAARILPSYHRSGGWDYVDARVEVTYPTIGLGTFLSQNAPEFADAAEGEQNALTLALSNVGIPTATAIFPLYDDGTHGDVNPANGHWTTTLTGLKSVDGMYRLRYIFDLTAGSCTTRREATQNLYVSLRSDPRTSRPKVRPLRDGLIRVSLRPQDAFGNLWGPGRPAAARCLPRSACEVVEVGNQGNGSYDLDLKVDPSIGAVRLAAFDANFDIELDCDTCPTLAGLTLPQRQVEEHAHLKAEVILSEGAAYKPGTTVFLQSSNPQLARVQEQIVIPASQQSATFPVEILHSHGEPEQVEITARLGNDARTVSLFVRPAEPEPAGPFVLPEDGYMMMTPADHSQGEHE